MNNFYSGKARVFSIVLSLMMALTVYSAWGLFGTEAFADTKASAPKDTLQESMEYLVNECGQRLHGTPNEGKAAEYIRDQYRSFGYKDIEWKRNIPLSSTSYVGRLVFNDGSADILGNAYPATPKIGGFDEFKGKITDLGSIDFAGITLPDDPCPEIEIPEGAAGNIVGAIRFASEPSIQQVEAVIEKISENTNVTLTGLLIARDQGTKREQSIVPRITGTTPDPTVPCISTPLAFLEKAIEKKDNFFYGERYAKRTSHAVVAKKPAATDKPDAIIIVSSHLDCVLASPGASDNASGAAANIELANRFANADLGNIEVWFAAVGAEDGGGMVGSKYVAANLTDEQKKISINMNMDMLCSDQPYTSDGVDYALDAISMDISPYPLKFNLPAYLVTNTATSVKPWAAGIENVRIYRYGSSDHVQFQGVGIDAASMIVATDEDDDIESVNHTAQDNLKENYSYDRLLNCTNLIGNGIQKAADQTLSKRVKLAAKDMGAYTRVRVDNANQLFKTYNKVTVTLTGENNGETTNLVFTKDKPYANGLPAHESFTVSNAVAYGSGIADNKNAERNAQYQNFEAKMVPEIKEVKDCKITVNATTGGKVTGAGTFESGKNVTLKAKPNQKYRFAGWYDSNGKKLSSSWKYSFTAESNTKITAKFSKIKTPAVKVIAKAGKKATISWKKVDGAYKYQIYRATSKNGSYKKVATVGSSKTSYTNSNLKTGKKYYYKVRVACKAENVTYGAFSTAKGIKGKK